MRVEVYAANLRVGGAVVTAASVLDGIRSLVDSGDVPWISELTLVVSPQVLENMSDEQRDRSTPREQLVIRDESPWASLLHRRVGSHDIRYVVFGPDYVRPLPGTVNVAGFADGSIIPAWQMPRPVGNRPRPIEGSVSATQREIKRRLLGRYDGFVVQTQGMANAISERFPGRPTAVVSNLLSSVFCNPDQWVDVLLPPRQTDEIRFFYPSRGWPHKNHRVLPEVSRVYASMYGGKLTFVTTLTEHEFASLWPHGTTGVLNVGPVISSQIPRLFMATDGLFMPSLNETFSSSPLEAAYMRKPIIVSDLPFFRSVLGNMVEYWRVGDFAAAAASIRQVALQERGEVSSQSAQIESAYLWASERADSRQIAHQHLAFLARFAF